MKIQIPDRENSVLFITTFFIAFSITMMAPILPEIKNEFQLSYTAVSFVLSSFAISRLILSLPTGYLYERINRKKLLIAGIILLSAGSLVAGLSKDFIVFLLSLVIMGAGFSICITTILVSLSVASTKENRGRMLGMNSFARSIGAIAAPSLAGVIAASSGWRNVFLFYAGMSLFCIAIVYFYFSTKSIKSENEDDEKEVGNYKKTLYGLFFVMFLSNLIFAGFRNSAVPLFAADVIGLDVSSIGFILSISAVVFLLSAPLSAYMSDKHGRKIFIVLATLALTLSAFGFLLTTTYTHLLLIMLFFGYGSIVFVSSVAMLGDITTRKKASKNFSVMRFISDLGIVVGPLITGIILDLFGFSITGWIFGILSFLTFLIALYLLEEPKFKTSWKKMLNMATLGRLEHNS